MAFLENGSLFKGLRPGDHLGFFYETEKEHAAVIKSFLRNGLEQGCQVLYITHFHSPEAITNYLREDGFEIEAHIQRSDLRFLSIEETYLSDTAFSPDRMLNLLASASQDAREDGYSGLHVTGEMSWILEKPAGSEKVVVYESRVTELTRRIDCFALCQYDMRLFPATLLLYMLATHPTILLGTKLLENPYHMVPAPFMGQEPATEILSEWLNNLLKPAVVGIV